MSILVVGSIGSLAYVSKGFKDFDYKTWFKSESDNILVDEISENVFKVKYTLFGIQNNNLKVRLKDYVLRITSY